MGGGAGHRSAQRPGWLRCAVDQLCLARHRCTNGGINKATLGWVLSTGVAGHGGGLGAAGQRGRQDRATPDNSRVPAWPWPPACLARRTPHGSSKCSCWRLLTGLGIGGTSGLRSTLPLPKCTNSRWRSLAMALMVIGYPLGGMLGGIIVKHLLASGTWHEVFMAGAGRRPPLFRSCGARAGISGLPGPAPRSGALERINRILVRFGHAAVSALTPRPPLSGAALPRGHSSGRDCWPRPS